MRVIRCTRLADYVSLSGSAEFQLDEPLAYGAEETSDRIPLHTSRVILSPVFEDESLTNDWHDQIDVFVNVRAERKREGSLITVTRGTLFQDEGSASVFADKFYRLNEQYIAKNFPQFIRSVH